jgi:hypothetical protein
MQYLPTIQLTSQVSILLSKGALHLQPGQWVAGEKGIGRYLRTDHRTGTTYVSWVRPGDDWTTQSQRFHRACMKGYVGKYASRYEGLKPARPKGRHLRDRSPSSHMEEEASHSAATL